MGERRGSNNRGFCRQFAGRGETIAAPQEGDRADRRRILLRRHRLDRARLAHSRHGRHQIRYRTGSRHHRQRHRIRHVHRRHRSGRIFRPLGPPHGLPVQPAAVRRLHHSRRACPDRDPAGSGALRRRPRAGRRTTARLRLCRRIFAQAHSRPHPRLHSLHWRRLRVADRLAVHACASATRSAGAACGS